MIKFKNILSEGDESVNFNNYDRKILSFIHFIIKDLYDQNSYEKVKENIREIGIEEFLESKYTIQEEINKKLKSIGIVKTYERTKYIALFVLNYREDGNYKDLNGSNINIGFDLDEGERQAVAKQISVYPYWVNISDYVMDYINVKGMRCEAYNIPNPPTGAWNVFKNKVFYVYSSKEDIEYDFKRDFFRNVEHSPRFLFDNPLSDKLNLMDYLKNGHSYIEKLKKEAIEWRFHQYYDPNDPINTLINLGLDDEYQEIEETYIDLKESLDEIKKQIRQYTINLEKLYKEKENTENYLNYYSKSDDGTLNDIDGRIYEYKYAINELQNEYDYLESSNMDVIDQYEKFQGENLKQVVYDFINNGIDKYNNIFWFLKDYVVSEVYTRDGEYNVQDGFTTLIEEGRLNFDIDRYIDDLYEISTLYHISKLWRYNEGFRRVDINGKIYYVTYK